MKDGLRITDYRLPITSYRLPITSNRLPITIFGLLLTLLVFTAGVVAAQTGEVSDDEVNAVAKDVFCPVCESTPLDVCPTKACADWRELIRAQLAEGKTPAEIHDYFARQYGDGVLANPPKRGFNLLLWVLPVIGVAVGGVLFFRYVRHLRQEGEATTAVSAKPTSFSAVSAPQPAIPVETSGNYSSDYHNSDDYLARVEEELQARR